MPGSLSESEFDVLVVETTQTVFRVKARTLEQARRRIEEDSHAERRFPHRQTHGTWAVESVAPADLRLAVLPPEKKERSA